MHPERGELISAIALAALGVTACESHANFQLVLPDLQGAQSLIVAAEVPAANELEVHALNDQNEDARVSLNFSSSPVELSVLLYEQALGDLGLSAGRVHPVAASEPRATRFSNQGLLSGWGAEARPGSAPRWERLDEPLSGALGSFWYQGRDTAPPCPSFSSLRSIEVDVPAHATFAGRFRDGSLGFGTERVNRGDPGLLGHKLVRLVPPDGVELIDVDARVPLEAGAIDEDDFLWLAGEGGELWKGRLEGTTLTATLASVAPSGETIRWMSISAPGEPFELFALSYEGAFERFDGQGWEVLGTFERGVEREGGGLARVGFGRALAISATSVSVLWYENGVTSPESPAEDFYSYTTVAFVPGLGPVVGGGTGRLFVRRELAWEELGQSTVAASIRSISPIFRGFVYAGPGGNFGYFDPEASQFCRLDNLVHTTLFVLPFGDEWVGFGDLPTSKVRLPVSVFRWSE